MSMKIIIIQLREWRNRAIKITITTTSTATTIAKTTTIVITIKKIVSLIEIKRKNQIKQITIVQLNQNIRRRLINNDMKKSFQIKRR